MTSVQWSVLLFKQQIHGFVQSHEAVLQGKYCNIVIVS